MKGGGFLFSTIHFLSPLVDSAVFGTSLIVILLRSSAGWHHCHIVSIESLLCTFGLLCSIPDQPFFLRIYSVYSNKIIYIFLLTYQSPTFPPSPATTVSEINVSGFFFLLVFQAFFFLSLSLSFFFLFKILTERTWLLSLWGTKILINLLFFSWSKGNHWTHMLQ